MKKLYRILLIFFIIVLTILLIPSIIDKNKYNFFIANGNGKHSVIIDGTFVFFKNIPIDELKEYDIILIDNNKIGRIISIDNENNTFGIVYDDFDKSIVEIPKNICNGLLVFHLNEIGNLYEDFLKPYNTYFLVCPFIAIIISFVLLVLYLLKINNEDYNFIYEYKLEDFYDNNKYYGTRFLLDDENAIYTPITFSTDYKIPIFKI